MVTPVAQLHLLHILASRTDSLTKATAVRDQLLSRESGRESFDVFRIVLRFVFEKLRQRVETSEWHLSVFIGAAWSHTARLHNLFLFSGVPNATTAKHFGSALANISRLLEAHPAGLFDDVAYGARVEWSSFLVRGFGSVLQALPDATAARLVVPPATLRAAIEPGDQLLSPIIMLAQETETHSNALPSFLGGPWAPPVAAVLSTQTITEWFPGDPQTIAVTQLAVAEANPFDQSAWALLRLTVGDAPFPSGHSDRIIQLLERIELLPLLEGIGERASIAFGFLCAQARHYGTPQLRVRLEHQLVQVAFQVQTEWEQKTGLGADNAVFNRFALQLSEAAFLLSANGQNTVGPFSAIATKLVQASPALGTVFREHLGGRVPPLPFVLARGAWPFYLALRASP